MKNPVHDPDLQAQTLIQALPYIREFSGATLVIKYGGAAMLDEELKRAVMRDLVLMRYVGVNPILVHGGGPEVSEAMRRMGKEPEFVGGLRVTDAKSDADRQARALADHRQARSNSVDVEVLRAGDALQRDVVHVA